MATVLATAFPSCAQGRPVKLVVFGDSLSAGLGLPAGEAFPAKLSRALKAKGLTVDIADARLNQRDGVHPNAAGVDVIVARILPKVEELSARVRAKSPS